MPRKSIVVVDVTLEFRIYLKVKNMKKQENESSKKILETVKCLFSEVSINIPHVCIDCANHVSRTDDTVIVNFTTFRHCAVTCSLKE